MDVNKLVRQKPVADPGIISPSPQLTDFYRDESFVIDIHKVWPKLEKFLLGLQRASVKAATPEEAGHIVKAMDSLITSVEGLSDAGQKIISQPNRK